MDARFTPTTSGEHRPETPDTGHENPTMVNEEKVLIVSSGASPTFGSELSLLTGEQKTPGARVPGVFSCASPDPPHVKRFATIRACCDVPPLDSWFRNATRGLVPNGHCSARYAVPNGPKLSDSLVDTPLEVNRTFRHGGPNRSRKQRGHLHVGTTVRGSRGVPSPRSVCGLGSGEGSAGQAMLASRARTSDCAHLGAGRPATRALLLYSRCPGCIL